MFADPGKVALRRIKRRLKASASVVLAVAAGVFLACRGGGGGGGGSGAGPVGRNPGGPDARGGRGEIDARRDTGAIAVRDAGADGNAGDAEGGRDAGAIVLQRDAGRRAPRVDRREHRDGMPVIDNLLE